MTTFSKFILPVLLAGLALPSGAWTLFSSREGALRDRLGSGAKLMARADAAYDAGDMALASRYYGRALEKFEAVQKADPDFMDGLAALHIAHCAEFYSNAVAAASAPLPPASEAAAGEAEPDAESDPKAVGQRVEPVAKEDGKVAAKENGKMVAGNGGKNAAKETGKVASAPSAPVAEAAEAAEDEEDEEPPADEPPPRPAYDARNFSHDFTEARLLLEDGNLSEAAAVLIPMLRHDPSNRQVRLLLAIVRSRQGRFDEAIVALEDLRGLREDLPLLLALSGAYMGAARYHDALLALDAAVKLNPADPNAFLDLAWLTLVMPSDADTLRNAEIYYRQAIKRGAARDRALEARIGLRKW